MSNTGKFLSVLLFLMLAVSAILSALPAAALPPRPTPIPTPQPVPRGGLITLTAVTEHPISPDLWTRVQWQDRQGDWHEVDGWRGAFGHDLTVTWWVAPEDLDTGPFRWLVYAAADSDEIIAISAPFDLPPAPGQTTAVTVTLPTE